MLVCTYLRLFSLIYAWYWSSLQVGGLSLTSLTLTTSCAVLRLPTWSILLILHGNTERGAHAGSKLCLRHSIEGIQNSIFLYKDLHACATCSKLPPNINTMVDPQPIHKTGDSFSALLFFFYRHLLSRNMDTGYWNHCTENQCCQHSDWPAIYKETSKTKEVECMRNWELWIQIIYLSLFYIRFEKQRQSTSKCAICIV